MFGSVLDKILAALIRCGIECKIEPERLPADDELCDRPSAEPERLMLPAAARRHLPIGKKLILQFGIPFFERAVTLNEFRLKTLVIADTHIPAVVRGIHDARGLVRSGFRLLRRNFRLRLNGNIRFGGRLRGTLRCGRLGLFFGGLFPANRARFFRGFRYSDLPGSLLRLRNGRIFRGRFRRFRYVFLFSGTFGRSNRLRHGRGRRVIFFIFLIPAFLSAGKDDPKQYEQNDEERADRKQNDVQRSNCKQSGKHCESLLFSIISYYSTISPRLVNPSAIFFIKQSIRIRSQHTKSPCRGLLAGALTDLQ